MLTKRNLIEKLTKIGLCQVIVKFAIYLWTLYDLLKIFLFNFDTNTNYAKNRPDRKKFIHSFKNRARHLII